MKKLLAVLMVVASSLYAVHFINEQELPLVISGFGVADFQEWAEEYQEELQEMLAEHGALLLRDFSLESSEEFAAAVSALLGKEPVSYRSGEGSRSRVAEGVYTSTKAPQDFHIPLHHELSCTDHPLSYICFYCEVAPEVGSGQTLLGRTEGVTQAIRQHPEVWELFRDKMIKYISRHPPEGSLFTKIVSAHRSWPESFETADKEEVLKICEEKGFECHWLGEWLEVIRRAPAMRGPDETFDFTYWYNQAHLYHPNPRIRGGLLNHFLASLLYIVPSKVPYDVEFDDGSQIPRAAIYQIYDALEQETIKFDWKKGDLLIVDNRRVLHGKAPHQGERRILVCMVE